MSVFNLIVVCFKGFVQALQCPERLSGPSPGAAVSQPQPQLPGNSWGEMGTPLVISGPHPDSRQKVCADRRSRTSAPLVLSGPLAELPQPCGDRVLTAQTCLAQIDQLLSPEVPAFKDFVSWDAWAWTAKRARHNHNRLGISTIGTNDGRLWVPGALTPNDDGANGYKIGTQAGGDTQALSSGGYLVRFPW